MAEEIPDEHEAEPESDGAELESISHPGMIPVEEIDRVVGSIVNSAMAAVGSLKNDRGERARFVFDQDALRADVTKIVNRMIFTDME